jgi:TetR/AcrR family transcriptional regulator, repressor for divergent bdcA
VTTTKLPRSRGRPRQFDLDEALGVAQELFHMRGYDGVSVSDITEALGINAPSFYAAFGNKASLYARILQRWTEHDAIPLADLLRDDRPVAEGLSAVLADAACRYAAEPAPGGCMVLEGARCLDEQARETAAAMQVAAESVIFDFVAARHPLDARRVTDYVSTVMAGMSANARRGLGRDRLLETSRLASVAITGMLSA